MTLQQSHRIADAVESLREAKFSAEQTEAELIKQYNAMPENVQESPAGEKLLDEARSMTGAAYNIDRAIEELSPYYD